MEGPFEPLAVVHSDWTWVLNRGTPKMAGCPFGFPFKLPLKGYPQTKPQTHGSLFIFDVSFTCGLVLARALCVLLCSIEALILARCSFSQSPFRKKTLGRNPSYAIGTPKPRQNHDTLTTATTEPKQPETKSS